MSDNQQRTTQGTGMNTTPGTQGYTTDATGDVVVPEYQEELVAGKVEQQEGTVHVHKDVVEEQQTVSAPVMREEVDVERVPVHNQLDTPPADAFQGADLDIPLRGEELVADKQVVESEEVRLRKHQVQEQEQVTGNVRREEVEVDQPSTLSSSTSSTGTMATAPAAQTVPTQSATTETIRTTPLEGATTGTMIQGADTLAQSGTAQQGTTYRIEAEPVQDTMQQTDSTVQVQGAAQQTGGTAQGAAQQGAANAQQGASDAKGKLDNAIDGVADKIFGRDH